MHHLTHSPCKSICRVIKIIKYDEFRPCLKPYCYPHLISRIIESHCFCFKRFFVWWENVLKVVKARLYIVMEASWSRRPTPGPLWDQLFPLWVCTICGWSPLREGQELLVVTGTWTSIAEDQVQLLVRDHCKKTHKKFAFICRHMYV